MTTKTSKDPESRAVRLAYAAVVALVVLPALVLLPDIREPFRLPKLLLSEGLALVSVAFLALALAASRARSSSS